MFTFFNGCGIPPVTLTCPPGGQAQVQTAQGCSPPILGPTGTQGCTQPGHCVGPTGTQGCTMPPNCLIGPTAYLGCHQGTAQAQTILPPTWFGQCGVPPVTITAPAQAQTIGITGWYGCTVVGPTGTHGCTIVGPTGTQGCLTPTGTPPATVCPQPTGTAQAQTLGPTGTQGCTVVGPTGYEGCHQHGTAATLCTQVQCDGGNAQAQTIGHTAYPGCGQPGTMATVCTQVQCGPTHLLGCTGYEGCHQPAGTAATECTQIGCDGGNAQAQIHSIPVVNCIPTRSCTGVWPAC